MNVDNNDVPAVPGVPLTIDGDDDDDEEEEEEEEGKDEEDGSGRLMLGPGLMLLLRLIL
jgi:hypothetical protein